MKINKYFLKDFAQMSLILSLTDRDSDFTVQIPPLSLLFLKNFRDYIARWLTPLPLWYECVEDRESGSYSFSWSGGVRTMSGM